MTRPIATAAEQERGPPGKIEGRHAPQVIVIGAGIAGLMAATDLSHRGHRVLVLEHNHQAGGLMSGMWRRGFYFDVGCQSFENMGIVFPLLEQYGLADLADFRRARYRIAMPGLDADVTSLDAVRAAFQEAYPESADGFRRVFDQHGRTAELVRRLFVPERIPFVRDGTSPSLVRWALGAFQGTAGSPRRLLARARELRTLLLDDFAGFYERELPASGARDLLANCGYTRMNVFIASAFWHLWASDYWYPAGGLQPFFDRWVRRLEERGVTFLFKRTVTALDRAGGRVTAVRTRRGEVFEAREVIYAGDYRQAVHRLVGSELFPRSTVERLERTRHSDALVSVYLGLDLAPEALREQLRANHVFYFPTFDCRTHVDPDDAGAHRRAFLEVTAHGIDDPALAPPGRSALVVQAFTRHDWLRGWATGRSGDPARDSAPAPRPPEYRQLKRRVADELVATLEGLLPGVGARIVYADVGAPPSTVRFTRNAFGASCGFELNWRNFPFLNPLAHVNSPLANLHMAGHFTVWPGAVPTAALSGKIASLRAHQRLARGSRSRQSRGDSRGGAET